MHRRTHGNNGYPVTLPGIIRSGVNSNSAIHCMKPNCKPLNQGQSERSLVVVKQGECTDESAVANRNEIWSQRCEKAGHAQGVRILRAKVAGEVTIDLESRSF
jgi:hypothetical protein